MERKLPSGQRQCHFNTDNSVRRKSLESFLTVDSVQKPCCKLHGWWGFGVAGCSVFQSKTRQTRLDRHGTLFAKDKPVGKQLSNINLMKTKILCWAMLTLAVAALAGCGRNSTDENPPASTNSAGGQPMPGATVSNNVVTPPSVPNPGNTNSSSATNQ
jgi:predicted small lipoprotein YifL